MNNVLTDSSFKLQIVFPDEFVFQDSTFANTQNTLSLNRKNQTETEQHELKSEKGTFWFPIHVNGTADTYYSENKAVKEVIYFPSLDSFVLSKDLKFLQNNVLQHDGASFHVTRSVYYISNNLYPN